MLHTDLRFNFNFLFGLSFNFHNFGDDSGFMVHVGDINSFSSLHLYFLFKTVDDLHGGIDHI